MTGHDRAHAPGPLTIEAFGAVRGRTLLITYRVRSLEPQPIYVGLVPTWGSGDPRFGDVNRLLTRDGELLLDFGPPPPQQGTLVYARAIPLSIELDASGVLEGRLECDVPVLEYHAYSPPPDTAQPDTWEETAVVRVHLRFWAMRVADAAFARSVPGYADLVRAGGGEVLAPTCVIDLDEPLEVWRRVDEDYWRE